MLQNLSQVSEIGLLARAVQNQEQRGGEILHLKRRKDNHALPRYTNVLTVFISDASSCSGGLTVAASGKEQINRSTQRTAH